MVSRLTAVALAFAVIATAAIDAAVDRTHATADRAAPPAAANTPQR